MKFNPVNQNILPVIALLCLNLCQSFAQGTVIFYNRGLRDPQGQFYEAPVSVPGGAFAEGPHFVAGLFLVSGDELTLIGTSPFRPGGAAGFFLPEVFEMPGALPLCAPTLRVRVWESVAGSYDAAIAMGLLHGEFPTINGDNTIVAGPLGSRIGQFSPPTLDGILPFTLVPEPSTALLSSTGLLTLIIGTTLRKQSRATPRSSFKQIL